MIQKIFIPIFILFFCLFILSKWTHNFTAFTVFSHTLESAGKLPRTMLDISLINQDGTPFHIKESNKYKMINFVYLNCPFVCHKVNNQLEQIYYNLTSNSLSTKIDFITISFDIKNDDIKKIKNYRKLFSDDISGWTFALPYRTSQKEFDFFLEKLGIWKYTIPRTGLINHSIYIFLVSPENNLIKVFDPARDTEQYIIQQINSCLKS